MNEAPDQKLLVVEDDLSLRRLLEEELAEAGYSVQAVADAEAAWRALHDGEPAIVVSDLKLPGADGMGLLREARQLPVPPGFIMITAFGTVAQAVEALKQGADDFLTKPVDLEHLLLCVQRVGESRRLRRELEHYRQLLGKGDFHGMIGRSACMQRLFTNVRQTARAAGPVLVTGESGVGKELVAEAVHRESKRHQGPFIAVNCAGIPAELLESELFGHTAGAFTGAHGARRGLFAEADGGTLLLDELGELPISMQAKLLRVLQDGCVRPVGANREQNLDVRVIAATNSDLEREVDEGRFRKDLFYRLETFTLHVPVLRERGEDLELLTACFIDRFTAQLGHDIHGITDTALQQLKHYPFPGNVRELANAIERAVAFCQEGQIDVAHLPERLREWRQAGDASALPAEVLDKHKLPTLEEVERRYIEHVLQRLDGNKRRAATVLGIGRRTLYRRLGVDESSTDSSP